MLKRDDFITIIRALRNASPTISNEQRKGLLRQAVQNYDLSVDDASEILQSLGLVVGGEIDYFNVLGFSLDEIQSLDEATIASRIEIAHKNLYGASLRAGGRPRADGRTEEQWRTLLNQARDTLIDVEKREAHIAILQNDVPPPIEFVAEEENLSAEQTLTIPSEQENLSLPLEQDGMVLIPASDFQMGSEDIDAFNDEKPVHTVYVDAFYMDKYPVTNAQYKEFLVANPQWSNPRSVTKFISATYHDGYYLSHWNKNNYPEGKADHPIVYISWYTAMAYAQWVGKRLPTEAEWEKAARGGLTDQKYPWGNSIDTGKANCDKNVGSTTPIGNYPANGYDLYNMVGNVWEWCLDEWDEGFYEFSPTTNPFSGRSIGSMIDNYTYSNELHVLRGGSWYNTVQNVRVAKRSGASPTYANSSIGFRCVKPVSQ